MILMLKLEDFNVKKCCTLNKIFKAKEFIFKTWILSEFEKINDFNVVF